MFDVAKQLIEGVIKIVVGRFTVLFLNRWLRRGVVRRRCSFARRCFNSALNYVRRGVSVISEIYERSPSIVNAQEVETGCGCFNMARNQFDVDIDRMVHTMV